MRSALIVFLFLLLAGFGAWILLSDASPTPLAINDVADTAKSNPADVDLDPNAKAGSALSRRTLSNTRDTGDHLPSSALTAENQDQGFQLIVRSGIDLHVAADAVVAVFAMRSRDSAKWRESIWLHDLGSALAPQPLFLLQTDSDGKVELPLPRDHYGISASTDDSFGLHFFTTQKPKSTHEVLLWPDRKLEILVQNQQGHPLAGIPVGPLQCGVGGIRFLGKKETNSDGFATFLHLGASVRHLHSTPMLSAATSLPWNIMPPTPVPIADLPERITLISPITNRVVVKLFDPQGKPFLEPCEVTLSALHPRFDREVLGPKPPPLSTTQNQTSANGAVTFENIGTQLDLLVKCSFGKTRMYVELLQRGPRDVTQETVVELHEEAGSVTFPLRILNSEGQPLANTLLVLTFACRGEQKHSESQWQEITTDEQGRVSWGMGAGGLIHNDRVLISRSIKIERPGTRQNPPASFTLDLFQAYAEGEQPSQDIVLEESKLLVTGTVLSPSGLPVADAKVQYFLKAEGSGLFGDMWFDKGQAVVTDSHGSFTIYSEPSKQKSRLTASHPDYMSGSLDFNPQSREPLVLQLENSFLVAGRILLDEHIPAQAIELRIHGKTEDGSSFEFTGGIKEDGRFSYSTDTIRPVTIQLTTGNLEDQIVWESAGVMPLPKAEIASQTNALIDLRGLLHEYELYVTTADGQPIADARVSGFHPNGTAFSIGSCRLGIFTMLGNGNAIDVQVDAPDYISQTLTLKPDGRTDLELRKGFEVRFQLTPTPTLPDDIFLILSLRKGGSDQGLLLKNATFDRNGSLAVLIPTYGEIRPNVSIMLKAKNMSMTSSLPGMEKSLQDVSFILSEGVTAPLIQIPINSQVVGDAISRMSDLRDRKSK